MGFMTNQLGFLTNKRPMPPKQIFHCDTPNFMPCPDVWDWIKATFLNKESKLYNSDHQHLSLFDSYDIAVMWANGAYVKKGRYVVGTAEKVMVNSSDWKKRRHEEQMRTWFPVIIPEFIITLEASYAEAVDDIAFCALVEHELYHIAHKMNEFGCPMYSRSTGKPQLELRGHDVEEFVGVTRRYGIGNNKDLKRMVDAAMSKPEVARSDVHHACGTCYLKVV